MPRERKTKDRRFRSPDGTKGRVCLTLSNTCLATLNVMKGESNVSRSQLIELAVFSFYRPNISAKGLENELVKQIQHVEHREIARLNRKKKNADRKDAKEKLASKADQKGDKKEV